jgi:outer membrane biogenesis lipoprotein LolB
MKKIFAFAFIAAAFTACNDADTDTTSVDTDTTTTSTTMTTTRSYSAAEGDVSYRNEKLMVYRNGNWVESDKDVTLDNGIVGSWVTKFVPLQDVLIKGSSPGLISLQQWDTCF